MLKFGTARIPRPTLPFVAPEVDTTTRSHRSDYTFQSARVDTLSVGEFGRDFPKRANSAFDPGRRERRGAGVHARDERLSRASGATAAEVMKCRAGCRFRKSGYGRSDRY